MKTACFLVAVAAVCLPGATDAQVTGVVTQSTAQLQFNPATADVGVKGLVSYAGQNISGVVNDGATSTGQYQVTTQVQPNDIAFANGATSSGPYDYATTTTSIDVSFTNDGATAVRPRLESVILPGGFGFYLANTTGCAVATTAACPQVAPTSALGFGVLRRDRAAPAGSDLAGATFSLTISSGATVMESLSGSITLYYNAADPAAPIVVTTLGGLASTLNGFGLATPAGSRSAVGYQWNQTGLSVDFPPGLLAPGASDTLTYTTVVSDYTRGDCLKACQIVAYGGFGDPIGQSGGSGGDARAYPHAASGGIGGVSYGNFSFGLPTFANGVLTFEPAGAAPEPDAWALMLIGVAFVGARLRRRGRPAAACRDGGAMASVGGDRTGGRVV